MRAPSFDSPIAHPSNAAVASPLFSQQRAKTALGEAVEAVEARSCAEVVIAVRPWSASWLGPDVICGAVVAYLALLFTLFAPPIFGLVWIALIVAAGFFVGFSLSRLIPALRLRVAGAVSVNDAVQQAARARFVELSVTATRERSGILVYVSLAERRCVVVPDIGVLTRVPKTEWNRAAAAVEDTVNTGGIDQAALTALCSAVEALGDVLEEPMPRAEDDIDELENVA